MSSSNNTSLKKLKPGKTTAFFICVLVAAFLWLVRSLNTTYTQTVKIPVEFKNVPISKKPVGSLPDFVSVDIKASGLKLFFILLNQPFKKLEIDFNDLKTANRNYVLSPSGINLKRSLKFESDVKRISPDTLYFIENSGYQKSVPVKLVYNLKCTRGFGYKNPAINPAFVSVVGDSASIRNIDTIYTQPFMLDNLSESVDKQLTLLKPNDKVYLSATRATINIQVERLVEQDIVLPIAILNPPLNAKSIHVFPTRVKLKFTSLQNDFNPADTANFKAAIDVANSLGGKSRVFLSTQPGNVNVLSISPPEAEILIMKK